MSNDGERALFAVLDALKDLKLEHESSDIQDGQKLVVRSGLQSATVNVYNSGSIVVGGKASDLKTQLEQMREALVKGVVALASMPADVSQFPARLKERVPTVDEIVVRFLEEGVLCLRAKANLAAAFLLGAASERAVQLLIDAYVAAFEDPEHRANFQKRANNRWISTRFDEFKRSFASCKSKPENPMFHDIETLLEQTFQFCRMTRNDVGHPQAAVEIDGGVLLAHFGSFTTYVERIYALIEHFSRTPVRV